METDLENGQRIIGTCNATNPLYYLSPLKNKISLSQLFPNQTSKALTSFEQLNENTMVFVDNVLNCVFKADRTSVQYITTLAGECGADGDFADGNSSFARFNFPTDIIKDTRKASRALVADSQNKRVRSVEVDSGDVSTIIELPTHPLALLWLNHQLLVSATTQLYLIEWEAQNETIVVHTLIGETGSSAYGSFATVQFPNVRSLEVIKGSMVLGTDDTHGGLILLDMARNLSLPVCINTANCLESVRLADKPRCTLIHEMSSGLYVTTADVIYKLKGMS